MKPKISVVKIVNSLDLSKEKIDQLALFYANENEKSKHNTLSNISYELHILIEQLDEFNMNN